MRLVNTRPVGVDRPLQQFMAKAFVICSLLFTCSSCGYILGLISCVIRVWLFSAMPSGNFRCFFNIPEVFYGIQLWRWNVKPRRCRITLFRSFGNVKYRQSIDVCPCWSRSVPKKYLPLEFLFFVSNRGSIFNISTRYSCWFDSTWIVGIFIFEDSHLIWFVAIHIVLQFDFLKEEEKKNIELSSIGIIPLPFYNIDNTELCDESDSEMFCGCGTIKKQTGNEKEDYYRPSGNHVLTSPNIQISQCFTASHIHFSPVEGAASQISRRRLLDIRNPPRSRRSERRYFSDLGLVAEVKKQSGEEFRFGGIRGRNRLSNVRHIQRVNSTSRLYCLNGTGQQKIKLEIMCI